jgi:Ca-activated chloride channel homolog
MLAEDVLPSRIEAAKSTIDTFITERTGDTFGLVVFAGAPFLSIPFSDDVRGVRSVLSNIDIGYIRQDIQKLSGTAIGDALLLANESLS